MSPNYTLPKIASQEYEMQLYFHNRKSRLEITQNVTMLHKDSFTQDILTSQSHLCVAKRNSTVMVIITLKTILDEKEGHHFFQVIL